MSSSTFASSFLGKLMRKLLVLISVVVLLPLAGCGDSDDGGADTSAQDTSGQDTGQGDTVADTQVDDSSGGGECHSGADCTVSGETCLDPNPHNVCGIAPQEGCSQDSDCGTDGKCAVIMDGCSMDGYGSECGSGCTSDMECGEGLRCGAHGACEALPCDDPASDGCPAYQVCDPSRIEATTPVYDRHAGCFDVPCAAASDCTDPLACVNGRCQEGPGVCGELMAVP